LDRLTVLKSLAIVCAATNVVRALHLPRGLAGALIATVSLLNGLSVGQPLSIVRAATDFVLADNLATVLTRAHVAVIAL